MATQQAYLLTNVAIELNGATLVDVNEVMIEIPIVMAPRTSGPSNVDQQVAIRAGMPKITLKGFNASQVNYTDLQAGSQLTGFGVTYESPDSGSFLPPNFFTLYPIEQMIIGTPKTTLEGTKPSEWEIPIEFNVVNATTFGTFIGS